MNRHLAFDGVTASFPNLTLDAFSKLGTYIFSKKGVEPRSRAAVWDRLLAERPKQCVEVLEQSERDLKINIDGTVRIISLVNMDEVASVFLTPTVYIDITGLGHNAWSTLLRALLLHPEVLEGFIVYTEPDVYQPHESPSSTNLFDLTSAFGGIGPLPGMANLTEVERGIKTVLVPFFGL